MSPSLGEAAVAARQTLVVNMCRGATSVMPCAPSHVAPTSPGATPSLQTDLTAHQVEQAETMKSSASAQSVPLEMHWPRSRSKVFRAVNCTSVTHLILTVFREGHV